MKFLRASSSHATLPELTNCHVFYFGGSLLAAAVAAYFLFLTSSIFIAPEVTPSSTTTLSSVPRNSRSYLCIYIRYTYISVCVCVYIYIVHTHWTRMRAKNAKRYFSFTSRPVTWTNPLPDDELTRLRPEPNAGDWSLLTLTALSLSMPYSPPWKSRAIFLFFFANPLNERAKKRAFAYKTAYSFFFWKRISVWS